jgi:hypothetical protein
MLNQKVADLQENIHIVGFQPSRQSDSGTITVQERITSQSYLFSINYRITPDFVVTGLNI